jgi:membrane fusion protein (multidrug efflux system)
MAQEEKEEDNDVVKGFKSHIPLIAGILVVLLVLWYWHKEFVKYIRTDDAFVDSDKVGVAPKMTGRIIRLYYNETDSVKKGSLMAELDSSELNAGKNQIKTVIEQNIISVSVSESQYDLSKDYIELQKINVEKTKEDLSRAKIQFDGGVITLEKYEHVKKDFESAEARLSEADKKAAFIKSNISIALARLEKTKSQYNFFNTLLNNTRLYAPIDGFVAKRWFLKGDVVNPGQSVYSLVKDNKYWISVFLDETKLSHTKIGSKATIVLDAFPDNTLEGKIFYIASNIAAQFSLNPPNNSSGNFTKISQRFNVKISIDKIIHKQGQDKPIRIIPGMSAIVKIIK